VSGLVLNLNGNAISLSNRPRDEGVRNGTTLHNHLRARQGALPLTFAAMFPFSSNHPSFDPYSRQPNSKACAVRVKVLE
jgi:hypothetical protein